ncbi:hypothetical protein QBC37DRAFT_29303 [Rhypophila decipiens]|uniref:Uncharacterized protein n=1 Tax=Rhypophila decipiens TaxID=261697 RepID=A0AAN7B774_9PEZI|nr:hypothetical protein QBC37DRAFT_29303 [Rhypophila decipiens]
MKTASQACITLLVGLLPLALGQGSVGTASLAPSPTQSVGCEAHGDHWHCDGPRVTSITVSPSTLLRSRLTTPPPAVTSAPAHPDHDHDHDDHEDHDDDHEHHDDDHDDHDDDAAIKPSPTGSVGCVAHGDHWHCDGPATATPTQSATETGAIASGVSTVPTSAGTAGIQHGMALLSVLAAATIGAVFVL